MDYKEYDKVYQELLSEKGRIDIANEGKEKEELNFAVVYSKLLQNQRDDCTLECG